MAKTDYTAQVEALRTRLPFALGKTRWEAHRPHDPDERTILYINGQIPYGETIRDSKVRCRVAALAILRDACREVFYTDPCRADREMHQHEPNYWPAYNVRNAQRLAAWRALDGKPIHKLCDELEKAGIIEYRSINQLRPEGIAANG